MCEKQTFIVNINDHTADESLYGFDQIKETLKENENIFHDLFYRLCDMGDSRLEVTDGSMEVGDLQFNDETNVYTAELAYWTGIYMGCKDQNSEDDHYTIVEFTIDNNAMHFNIELPPAWVPE